MADDHRHECVDIAVGHGSSGSNLSRLLDSAAWFRGGPAAVRTDNCPELTSRAFLAWEQEHRIRQILIEPERPMQNGYIDSFNGKFPDECPNDHWFQYLHPARTEIAIWRRDCNDVGPDIDIRRMPTSALCRASSPVCWR